MQLVDALPRVLEDEWLETDGHGNYASCTPAMCPTRRYHGLLVASLAGREGRATLLSRFDEHLRVHREPWAFSVARYADTLAPEGHRALEAFELVPWPRASYELGGARLERELLLVPGRAAVLVRYGVVELEGEAELELRPLLPCRPAGELSQKNEALDPRIQRSEAGFAVQPYAEMPSLHFSVGGAPYELQSDPLWYERVEYAQELERGYDGHEDQWSPGVLRARLEAQGQLVVAIAVDAPSEDPIASWEQLSSARRREAESLPAGPRGQLELAARDFLYQDACGRSGVLAPPMAPRPGIFRFSVPPKPISFTQPCSALRDQRLERLQSLPIHLPLLLQPRLPVPAESQEGRDPRRRQMIRRPWRNGA